MTMGDRIVVMKDGRIEQVGPPLELYDHPANVFVAGFIGSPTMNFVDGVVSSNRTEVRLADGNLVPIAATGVAAGQSVTLGLRPEHLQVSSSGIAGEVLV